VFSSTLFISWVSNSYPGAWDAFCFYWDDGANFVNSELVNDPLTWSTFRAMLGAERINVYEPLALLLKVSLRGKLHSLEYRSAEQIPFGYIS